jgi:hypothetical protein
MESTEWGPLVGPISYSGRACRSIQRVRAQTTIQSESVLKGSSLYKIESSLSGYCRQPATAGPTSLLQQRRATVQGGAVSDASPLATRHLSGFSRTDPDVTTICYPKMFDFPDLEQKPGVFYTISENIYIYVRLLPVQLYLIVSYCIQ